MTSHALDDSLVSEREDLESLVGDVVANVFGEEAEAIMTAGADGVAADGAAALLAIHRAPPPDPNAAARRMVADVRAGLGGPVPPGLRDAHYAGAKKLGHGKTYVYPHDAPEGIVPQQYPPDALVGRDYYRPTSRGAEAGIGARLAKLRAILRRAR